MDSPTPQQIKEWRTDARLTQAQAAALIHSAQRSWQKWESGERAMHPAFWELFIMKASGAPESPWQKLLAECC